MRTDVCDPFLLPEPSQGLAGIAAQLRHCVWYTYQGTQRRPLIMESHKKPLRIGNAGGSVTE